MKKKRSKYVTHLMLWALALLVGFALMMFSGWGLVANPGFGAGPGTQVGRYLPFIVGLVIFGAAFLRLFVFRVKIDPPLDGFE